MTAESTQGKLNSTFRDCFIKLFVFFARDLNILTLSYNFIFCHNVYLPYICNRQKQISMDILKLTTPQQLALLESLEKQTAPFTTAEIKTLEKLNELFPKTELGVRVERVGDRIRLLDFDTFGENYRNTFVKLKETVKGEYFTMRYFDNKRVYLV